MLRRETEVAAPLRPTFTAMPHFTLRFTALVAGFFVFAFAVPVCAQPPKVKRLLLVGQGSDGHPPATHEFMAGVRVLEKLAERQREEHQRVEQRQQMKQLDEVAAVAFVRQRNEQLEEAAP